MRASGPKLVKFCAHTHTTAAKLVVRIIILVSIIIIILFFRMNIVH